MKLELFKYWNHVKVQYTNNISRLCSNYFMTYFDCWTASLTFRGKIILKIVYSTSKKLYTYIKHVCIISIMFVEIIKIVKWKATGTGHVNRTKQRNMKLGTVEPLNERLL